jgi:uncharacterized protein (DUF924 family)
MPPETVPSAEAFLQFWLQDIGPAGWYRGDAETDERCRVAAAALWTDAAEGGLGLWLTDARGALAYIILTDQIGRNIHRGGADAFALDPFARAAARAAVARGWDLVWTGDERQFFYLPFEHAEDPTDQLWSVDLFTARTPWMPDNILHARAHQHVIARFGRFPGRNAALGRTDTPDEAAWLAAGGYGAEVRALRGA